MTNASTLSEKKPPLTIKEGSNLCWDPRFCHVFHILISFPAAKKHVKNKHSNKRLALQILTELYKGINFTEIIFLCTFPKLLRNKVASKFLNNLIAPSNKYAN